MKRKQFTFYRSFYESIEKMQTNREKLQAYQIFCRYALDEAEPDPDAIKPCTAMVFEIARPIMDAAHNRARAAQNLHEQKQM